MTTIIVNGNEYKEGTDKRLFGCEFCDIRTKDYGYFRDNCLKGERPCGKSPYLIKCNNEIK